MLFRSNMIPQTLARSVDSFNQERDYSASGDDKTEELVPCITSDTMAMSFHQSYPAQLNPFARDELESDNESIHSKSTVSSKSSHSSRSSRNREPYESDYRYEPRQKVFTMADLEAEREAKKQQRDSRAQSPASSVCSQTEEGTMAVVSWRCCVR